MNVTILQTDIIWGCFKTNLDNAERLIASLPSTDLAILPEMYATGFGIRPDDNDIGQKTLAWMRLMAERYDMAVACTCAWALPAARADSKALTPFANRFLFVRPDGSYEYYDKRHLFTYAGENRHFQAGNQRTTVSHCGIRILLQVCYDLRFPVWSRNKGDCDMIIYSANWPADRRTAWTTLLRARAIENQCYVCGVNRVGRDRHNEYDGGSIVVSPTGDVIASCRDCQEDNATANIDINALRQFRERFPVLADRDEFTIKP